MRPLPSPPRIVLAFGFLALLAPLHASALMIDSLENGTAFAIGGGAESSVVVEDPASSAVGGVRLANTNFSATMSLAFTAGDGSVVIAPGVT